MKRRERFTRIVVALALTGLVASQVPATGNIAFAQTGGCPRAQGSFSTTNTAGTIMAVWFAAGIALAFTQRGDAADMANAPTVPDMGIRSVVRN